MAGVVAQGRNYQGQLCLGVKGGTHNTPTASPLLDRGVFQIAAGAECGAAVMDDGTGKAWGGQEMGGQLGDGTRERKLTPVTPPMPDGLRPTEIRVAGTSMFARLADATMAAWGSNGFGNQGNGESEEWNQKTSKGEETEKGDKDVLVPTRVAGLSGVASIMETAGGNAGCTLEDGRAFIWGENKSGQLGDGTIGIEAEKRVPQEVPGITTAVKMVSHGRPGEANKAHVLCLLSDGTVAAWGAGRHGELGNGESGVAGDELTPFVIPGITDAVDVAVGSMCSFIVKANGDLVVFGFNKLGQLGVGEPEADVLTPTLVLTGVLAVASHYTSNEGIPPKSGGFTMAVTRDGHLYGWGDNRHGQIGDGTVEQKNVPTLITSPTPVHAVACGEAHTLLLVGSRTGNRIGTAIIGEAVIGVPEAEVAPEVTLGAALKTTNGTWSNEPSSFSYVWERGGPTIWQVIPGAVGRSYVITEDDVGKYVRVTVTARNKVGGGSSTSAPVMIG